MTQFNIDVVSDTVCPWCYVGKRKLEKAIEQHKKSNPDDKFVVNWKPYFLNPDAPKIGQDKVTMYAQKFGADRTEQIFARLTAVGAQSGINFKFAGKSGWTGNSHRLISYAGKTSPDMQDRVVNELFAGYFENEQDITDIGFLVAAAKRAGLDEKAVETYLKTDEGLRDVQNDVIEAKMAGIDGVPNFVVGGKYEVGGAQDSSVFLQLFERIKAQDATKAKSVTGSNGAGGDTCAPDGSGCS